MTVTPGNPDEKHEKRPQNYSSKVSQRWCDLDRGVAGARAGGDGDGGRQRRKERWRSETAVKQYERAVAME